MKRLLPFLLLAGSLSAQNLAPSTNSSISLPVVNPVWCHTTDGTRLGDNPPGFCHVFPGKVGQTGVVIGRTISQLSDTMGNLWQKGNCTGFNNDCIYVTTFTVPNPNGYYDSFVIPKGEGLDLIYLVYDNSYEFIAGATGDYSNMNAAIVGGDGVNGQGYDKGWAWPIEDKAGDLEIEWGDANSSGPGQMTPGAGWLPEINTGIMSVADRIATVDSLCFGSMAWKNYDGQSGGGSHWLLGAAVLRRVVKQ